MIARVEAAFEVLECEQNIPLEDPEADEDGVNEAGQEQTQTARGTGAPTHLKHYRRLGQEAITRWNSILQMMSSLLSFHEEVNKALKRTSHYDLCILLLYCYHLLQAIVSRCPWCIRTCDE